MPKPCRRITVMLATVGTVIASVVTAVTAQALEGAGAAQSSAESVTATRDAEAAAAADRYMSSDAGRSRMHRQSGDVMVRRAVTTGDNDLRYVSYERRYAGLAVVGGDAVVVVDREGRVAFTSAALAQPIALGTVTPTLSAQAAQAAARAGFAEVTASGPATLVVNALASPPSLAWEVTVDGAVDGLLARQRVFVDAFTGAVVARSNETHDATGRGFYNGTVTFSTSPATPSGFRMVDPSRGGLSCRDVTATQPFTDPDDTWGNGTTDAVTACVDTMYGAQKMWDMLAAYFNRNGFDGNGGPAMSLLLDSEFANAQFDKAQPAVMIGRNDTTLRWFSALDTVGHELGHAVYLFTPGEDIGFNIEALAVNEAVADIFGTLTELFANNPNDPFDYTISEKEETPPRRVMYDPSLADGFNCYPAAGFGDFGRGAIDPHLAAGVVDHWFYLLTEGSNPANGRPTSPTCNDRTLTGIGIVKARQIVFNALLAKTANWQMAAVRTASLNAAKALFPGCVEFQAVRAAWDAVSVEAQQGEPTCAIDLFGAAATGNASDPSITRCTDPSTGTSGFCLYASQDLGTRPGVPNPPDNPYPMRQTLAFFSPDGRTWLPKGDSGAVLVESQYPWVPTLPNSTSRRAEHLWAPAMAAMGGTNYLYVPDVSDATAAGVHTSSRIGLSTSSSPFGPFTPSGWVCFETSTATPNCQVGYMSGPEVFADTGVPCSGSESGEPCRYLTWTNGDNTGCGGISIGQLVDGNMGLIARQSQGLEVTINGVGVLGNCGGRGRPYLDGASLYKFSAMTSQTGLPGPYTLVFMAKPADTPPECSRFQQPNTNNSVIAYATSTSVRGPYQYQGIIMCGSSSEWTDHASIAVMKTNAGADRIVMVYHDGPAGQPNRRLHAECLWYGAGTFAMVLRSPTGFADCMNGAGTNAWVLRSRVTSFRPEAVVSAVQDNNGVLQANRAAVGPWEQFDVLTPAGAQLSPTSAFQIVFDASIRSRFNNRFVAAENAGTANLIANRTVAREWERFIVVIDGLGGVALTSEQSGLEVTSQANRTLVPTNPARAPDEVFDILHL